MWVIFFHFASLHTTPSCIYYYYYTRIDPMNEVEVEAGAKLTTIAKSKQADGGDQNIWYIQVRTVMKNFFSSSY